MGQPDEPALDATALAPAGKPLSDGDFARAGGGEPGPGAELGRYRLRHVLGRGGMGVVYAADDPALGRRVAIKLIRGAPGVAARQRLEREAQAMARLSHPNVIAVHDVGTVGDQVFLAMELVAGGDLREWLRGGRGQREIVEAFVAAGRGLAAAHAAGLVHRDFKPDNVLIADGRVRVTDFGLARVDGVPLTAEPSGPRPTALDAPLTHAGEVMGTPVYMSPEQHAGQNVDARSDQFSFAAALYEALYGERPFVERSYDELVAAIAAGAVKEPPRGKEVPSSLRKILLRALSPRPGDRYPTMEAMLEALSRDATRVPRRIARLALALLVPVAVAIGADWIVRERTLAVTRSGFAAAGEQLGRLLGFRSETFVALSDLSTVSPVLRRVTAEFDESDFGLGDAADDQETLRDLHENLRSATWSWATAARGGMVAVADYKGRLLYSSAAPDSWGGDLRAVPAIGRAYQRGAGVTSALVRADAMGLVASGLVAPDARGLLVLFARAVVLGDRPQAVFIQGIPAERLLADVALGEDALIGLVAPDGSATGSVPPAVLDRAPGATSGASQVAVDGEEWLVQRHPLDVGEAGIGSFVLARRLDVGLAGLFVGARLVLGGLAGLLLVTAALATWLARRR